jgi:hypothetical protein
MRAMAATRLTEPPGIEQRRPAPAVLDRPSIELPACSGGTRRPGWIFRLALAATGLLPVALVAACAFGAEMRPLSFVVLAPALIVTAVAVGRDRAGWTLAIGGVTAGILATAPYDLFRFLLLGVGMVHRDPIPHLGTALGLHPDWVFGYLWRYVGDGGGLALAFVALNLRGPRQGALFGLSVCAGLLVTLAVSPHGQQLLFPLNRNTVFMATAGHIIYGSVLGSLVTKWSGPGGHPAGCRVR